MKACKQRLFHGFSNFLVLSVISFLGAGCGDLRTPRDVNQVRNREQINQRLAELEPLIGEYRGELLEIRTGQTLPFELNIVLSGDPYGADGIPDETVGPSVAATALLFADRESEVYIAFPFERSDFDASTGRLVLYSGDPVASITAFTGSDGIKGSLSSSLRGLIGTFEARRVPRE